MHNDDFSEFTAERWHPTAQEAAFAAICCDILTSAGVVPVKYAPLSDADLADVERELRGDTGGEA
jgi:hypothetical protein